MYAQTPARNRPAPSRVFERPGYRAWIDLLGTSIGSIAFLAVVALIVAGRIDFGGGLFDIPAVVVFGFFGIYLGLGFVAAIRRGVGSALLEVGPAGMWTPEMGFLGWREIAEVRLEKVRGPGGQSVPADYRKIGIIPRDPARSERVHRSLAYRMYGVFAGFVRSVAPTAGFQDPGALAPFGVFDYELVDSVGSVVDAIREFHDVRMPDGSVAERSSASA